MDKNTAHTTAATTTGSAPGESTARVAMVTVDCADPTAEAEFWAAMTGGKVLAASEDYAMVSGEGPALGFGRVEEYEPPAWPNPRGTKQYHLDLAVTDVPAAERRALDLGASLADPQPGETWRVLLDLAGHPFCLTDAANWG